MLRHIVGQAQIAGISLSVCGEMASDPLGVIALVGLGVRSLSVAPTSINLIKEVVRNLDANSAEKLVLDLVDSEEHSLRSQFHEYALSEGIPLEP